MRGVARPFSVLLRKQEPRAAHAARVALRSCFRRNTPFWLAPAFLLLGAAQAPDDIPVMPAQVIATLPHDNGAFTEGLFYRDGYFWESTGEIGQSSIRKVKPETGHVVQRATSLPPYFGEGIVAIGSEIVSLTWRQGVGFRWSIDTLRRRGSFRYPGEGWALTTDGTSVIMSDGTASLRFLDPVTLKERHRLPVTANGVAIDQLNELEYVDGEILANVWRTNRIARIDPTTGHVVGWIDVTALADTVHLEDPDAVANGIAWDKVHRRLWVTGKYWPTMFEIAPPKGR
jgi:glutaminyl-peptide cyclotransferase